MLQLDELRHEASETVQQLLGLIEQVSKISILQKKVIQLRGVHFDFSRQVVDFPASLEKGSFCAKSCVSEELDELRRKLNGLPDLLQVVAEEEKERLPKEVGACVVSYIPHVGYLVAMPIKRALQEQGFDYHNIPGYHFMFENNGAAHYKNECTDSLDEKLGDVVLDITRTEMAIMAQVSNEVLQAGTCLDKAIRRVFYFSSIFIAISRACAEVDCLLAMAIVGKENNWVSLCVSAEQCNAVRIL